MLDNETYDIILQPETRPISQEQLVAEVKGIYAGLVMVEAKCIEVDNKQATLTDGAQSKLNNEQWQALIALHRTLLHEHHDCKKNFNDMFVFVGETKCYVICSLRGLGHQDALQH